MKKKKIAVLIYNYKGSNMWNRAINLFSEFPREEYSISFVHRKSNNLVDMVRFVKSSLKMRPDILYMMDIGLPSLIAALMLKLARIKANIVLDSGDLPHLMVKLGGSNIFVRFIVWATEELSYKFSDKIIVRGPYYKVYLKNKGYTNTFYVPDGTNTKIFKPLQVNKLRKKLGLEKFMVVGVMGHLYWDYIRKHSYGSYLIEAMSYLKDLNVKAVFVGSGEGLKFLKKKAMTFDVEDKVLFIGKVPYQEVPKYLNLMDVFEFGAVKYLNNEIRTSAKLPELLATGKFVIGTDVRENKRLIKENGIVLSFKGLDDPSYPKRLAKAIRKVYKNKSIIERGMRGVPIAKRNFEYASLSKRLEKILKK